MSKFLLERNTPFKLWKLHETIDHRLPARAAPAPPSKRRRTEEEQEAEEDTTDVQEVEELPPADPSTRDRQPRLLPADSKLRWSSQELAMIQYSQEITMSEAYRQYLRACEQVGLPLQIMAAFRRKAYRMASN